MRAVGDIRTHAAGELAVARAARAPRRTAAGGVHERIMELKGRSRRDLWAFRRRTDESWLRRARPAYEDGIVRAMQCHRDRGGAATGAVLARFDSISGIPARQSRAVCFYVAASSIGHSSISNLRYPPKRLARIVRKLGRGGPAAALGETIAFIRCHSRCRSIAPKR